MQASSMRISEAVARALHRSGAPTHRIEQAVMAVAAHQGRTAEVLATPTGITIEFDGSSRVLRLAPPGLDLGPLSDQWEIVHAFLAGELTEEQAVARLCAPPPRRYPEPVIVTASALLGGAGAIMLGGSGRDVLASIAVGLVTWLLWRRSLLNPRLAPLADVLAGFTAASLGGLLSPFGVSTGVVTVASVFGLLPGLSLVAAMSEVAAGSWTSGAARSVGVLATLARLGGGITIGHAITTGLPTLITPALPSWTFAPAVLLLGATAMIQLGAKRRDVIPGVIAGAITATINAYVGGATGTVAAAAVGGLLASGWSHYTRIPAQPMLIASLLPLVPGAISLGGTVALLEGDTDGLVTLAVTAIGKGLCVVGGMLLASAVAPEVAPGDNAQPVITPCVPPVQGAAAP